MVCTLEGRTDEVVHTRVHDEEVLGLAALDEEHARDEGGALCHERTSRFHMDLLVFAADDVLGNGTEPCLEIGDRGSVRIIVIDAETSSEVYVVDF